VHAGMSPFAPRKSVRYHSGARKDTEAVPYSSAVLPPGIRSRFVANINGIRMHVLEAGFETNDRPGVVLLHGFPESVDCGVGRNWQTDTNGDSARKDDKSHRSKGETQFRF
jgi:hypothetical protein